ncbi:Thiosulfate sulfurtransferase PspE precursor [compost metagenome]|nr:Rhodanese-related sulfurtransferase [Pedobacter sp. ok626]
MTSSFFSKSERDLDGVQFKSEFESAADKVLLDVRTPAEFQSGNLPKSVNIDFMGADFKNKMEKLDKSKTYFVYCRSGNRSGQAVSMMNKLGLTSFNLVGGIDAWPK